ncbi:TonB-dependent receptor [Paralcaligenes sp. KSB-10]|uniref:TonB-dependent receptor n=1 Tax=Paralcaligenes sp. KSB-10 TaxID=2901142 RepID=UPI001E5C3566|nr:TonB-dependent receptor [Paralcaligenes sp. KSB-10]UHL63410.1 TonB-dependent receptor [Paralcaligenes sp. KSB-10]
MNRTTRRLAPWALLGLLQHPCTFAAAPADETTLAPITITGQATAPSGLDPQLPASTQSVTARDLQQINVVNTEDAVKYLPNFAIRKRYIGDANSLISVRGTNNSQSARGLVYVDDMLLSNFLGNSYGFAPKWSMVFPDNIERVDTFYGPFSALYPGNSMGATVAITTKMPKKLEATASVQGFSQHFDQFGMDRNFNGSQSSATLGNKIGNASFLIGIDHLQNTSQPLQFATPQAANGGQPGGTPVSGAQSYIDQYGKPGVIAGTSSEGVVHLVQDQFKFKLAYDITPTIQAGASLSYWNRRYRNDNESFLRDPQGQVVYAGRVNIDGSAYNIDPATFANSAGRTESALYGLSLKSHQQHGWNFAVDFSSFDVLSDTLRTAAAGGTNAGPGTIESTRGSGWNALDAKLSYTPASDAPGAHWITVGYHFDRYHLDDQVFNTDDWQTGGMQAPKNAFLGSTATQAVYAQDAWKFASKWTLTTGLRAESWRAYSGARSAGDASVGYGSRHETHYSPKASLAYAATDDLTLRASVGRAYRFPTVSELFQGSLSGLSIVNNDPNLKPESTLSKELAADWYTDSGLFHLALFQDDVKDTLYSQTDTTVIPNITNIENIDRIRNRGIEISYQGENVAVAGLDLSAGVGYTRSKILENSRSPETEGNNFPRVPLWRINAVATYHFTQQTALTLAGRYSGRQYNTLANTDINPDTYGGSSSFMVFDAKLRYQVSSRIEASLGVDNLFDKRAYIYHPYPGRTIFAELKFKL